MSWVTDVILIYGLRELTNDDGDMIHDHSPCLEQINEWLHAHSHVPLVCFSESDGFEKAMQACVYGGAYNHFKISEFMKFLETLPWRQRDCVQLLTKDEEDERFLMTELEGPKSQLSVNTPAE